MSVYTVAQEFQRRVEALDTQALEQIERDLKTILPGLMAQAEAAAVRAAEMPESDARIFAAQRARSIALQVASEIDRVMRLAAPQLELAQQQSSGEGLAAARAFVEAALPEGMDLNRLASLGVSWTTADLGAVQAAIGFTSSGSSLQALLTSIGPAAADQVRTRLLSGIAAGQNPRVVARSIRDVTELSRARAETISRTEILRAFRESQRLTYERNPEIVKGYRRLAAKSSRSCILCLALDQQEQATDELMATHPNCRCALVPLVDGRLSGVSTGARDQRESGSDWFARQPAEVQQEILGGPGAFKAYREGASLQDFVRIENSREWGPTLRRATLAEIA